jgi:hypothetical protein
MTNAPISCDSIDHRAARRRGDAIITSRYNLSSCEARFIPGGAAKEDNVTLISAVRTLIARSSSVLRTKVPTDNAGVTPANNGTNNQGYPSGREAASKDFASLAASDHLAGPCQCCLA